MTSLRKRVFEYMDTFECDSPKSLYQNFVDENKAVLRQYYYQYLHKDDSNITIEIKEIDTIKEMEFSIQQIKDPVKRCENLSRLHNMKLKPIVNKNKITLKEMLDGS